MQVIEKAYKKLRLDALVIQQGRLVENTKSVNKEDLLSMVREGTRGARAPRASSALAVRRGVLTARGAGGEQWERERAAHASKGKPRRLTFSTPARLPTFPPGPLRRRAGVQQRGVQHHGGGH